MTAALISKIADLSEIQRTAVDWGDGGALVLAGPGAGKTSVLTCRVAKLLTDSHPRKFKVLALTFTTKAANEMKERVEALVPDLAERTFIGTFHAFCAALLRQHGSHIGLAPDFGIYSEDADRHALLVEVANAAGEDGPRAGDLLPVIDRLKGRLIIPEKTVERYADPNTGARVAKVYSLYEAALRAENRMDFAGLIVEACRLIVKTPAIAQRLRQTYPYWLIDEFQDTSVAQYRLIRAWAGDEFRNIFTVADDDQIIYQWAGASYRQLESFREHFTPAQIQLVENHRCPASVVEAANRLVAHNTLRTAGKKPLVPRRPDGPNPITVLNFATDAEEADAIADMIAGQPALALSQTAVIARGRAQLAMMLTALRAKDVKAVLSERRGRFVSPQFVWLHACLEQAILPADRRTFLLLAEAAERIFAQGRSPELIADEAVAAGKSFLEYWASVVGTGADDTVKAMANYAAGLVNARAKWRQGVEAMVVTLLDTSKVDVAISSDAEEDHAAWKAAEGEIRREKGSEPDLAEFIQGLALRSKSPPQDPGAVSLLTVHGAKGLEFEHVYVVGLAESVFPSYQSVQKGPTSPEMEEERRNCFVAVTRTKQTLVMSYAGRYKGYAKTPSRFLGEMELV